jgi:hypothetical protein
MDRSSIASSFGQTVSVVLSSSSTDHHLRFRPTLPWSPNETNLQPARTYLTRIKAQIEAGTFCFADEFPRYRGLQKPADAYTGNKKIYNNAISSLRRAFNFGYLDYPERVDPAAALKCARIGKKDRPAIDPFSIQDAEVLIAALHRDWGEAQGNYDELRFFTCLRPSEEIAFRHTRRQPDRAQDLRRHVRDAG